MDLKKQVIDNNGIRYEVLGIVVIADGNNESEQLTISQFNNNYEEYIDPKDLEIERLLAIIKDLEKPKVKPSGKRLTQPEKDEVRKLVEAGHEIIDIASTYNISTSSIYYWIKGGNWNFTKHRGA